MSQDIGSDLVKDALRTAEAAATGLTIDSAGCAQSATPAAETVTYPKGFTAEDYANSPVILKPITTFAEEKTYDIVVVGAGTSGMPAVLTALEEGAKVACLQRESVAGAQGNAGAGLILEESTELGILRWIQGYREACSYRCNLGLAEFWARHSGETLAWMDLQSAAAGYPPVKGSTVLAKKETADGSYVTTAMHTWGTKPESVWHLVLAMAEYAKKLGAEMFYSTPAVQLVKTGDRVSAVIGKNASGAYIKFNAKKAVILATGDYQNNKSLVERYSPDLALFAPKQFNKTGDGILLAAGVGGGIVPVPHTKQMHDMDAAPMTMTSLPFMAVNQDGVRFMNEEIPMINWNLPLRYGPGEDKGRFCRIFDNDYTKTAVGWGPPPTSIAAMQNYIPGAVASPVGVKPKLIDTHVANTLDELATKLKIPAEALKASVQRYNELCETGFDEDFGKQKKYLVPIKTPPFWGIRQWVRITATCGGTVVDKNYQVVDIATKKAIPGLYSVGWGAGDLTGGIDWPLYQGGMSIGSCQTSGRYATIHAMKGNFTPAKPAKWSDVKASYGK
ncbi:MAG: FAD-dependent oxidoreductase [Coriobacteriia bacterium]|nr:FAD-dependent oxidoreductase [Coriobacteriia bacterium]